MSLTLFGEIVLLIVINCAVNCLHMKFCKDCSCKK